MRVEQRYKPVQRLLGELEDSQTAIMPVMSKKWKVFSVEEIGEVLDLNVNTVKVRLFRARARLVEMYRKRMEKRPVSREELRRRRAGKVRNEPKLPASYQKFESRFEDYLGGAPDAELDAQPRPLRKSPRGGG